MNRKIVTLCALALLATPTLAQKEGGMPEMTPEQKAEMEAYMKAGTPGEQHRILASEVGTYDLDIKSWSDPAGPPAIEKGTAVRTVDLDGRVVVERVNATMMGTPWTGQSVTGYDNVSGKYWATWTDSMSTGIMLSYGSCDEKHACSYSGSWNDPIKKGPVTARFTTRRTGPTTTLFEMFGPGKDGKEFKMMEMTYTKR